MWRREGERAHYIDGASAPYNCGQEARQLTPSARVARSKVDGCGQIQLVDQKIKYSILDTTCSCGSGNKRRMTVKLLRMTSAWAESGAKRRPVPRHFTRRCCESVPCRTHSLFGNGRCARFANAKWPKSKGGLPDPNFRCTIADMKAQRKRDWLDECFEYEATHPIAFASPRALMEARLIAEMDKARLPHRRNHRNGVARRRKAVPG